MNNYDKINVPKFKEGKVNGYLCSMCGQYTSLNDSISHKGYNLMCTRCEWKIKYLLDDMEIINKIQRVGRLKEAEDGKL